MVQYGEGWSDDELRACAEIYKQAVDAGGTKKSISKDLYESRAFKRLDGRVLGAVSRRMCNISARLEANGREWVVVWKPLHNVGSGVEPRLDRILEELNLI